MEEILEQIHTLTPALIMTLGLAIGLEHAFEPDHVAAVTTQVSKQKHQSSSIIENIKNGISKSTLLGATWGAGHTTTLVLMGLLVFVLAVNIPKNVFLGLELLVGMMLVFLAFITFSNKKLFKLQHIHPHAHQNGTVHTHPHEHHGEHKHTHKSYIIGCIHGLAGSGALVVLTASTLGNIESVLSFILIFGIGSVIGMALVSGLIGLPFVFTNKIASANKIFRFVAGTTSFLIGASIIYEIGILENLFGI